MAGLLFYFFFFRFGDGVFFVVFEVFLGDDFFVFGECFFLAGAFLPLAADVFAAVLPFAGDVLDFGFSSFCSSTNLSTVQPTLTETTSSPGFTSTTTSPLVAARLRTPASSNRVDFGAPFLYQLLGRQLYLLLWHG